MFSPLRRSGNWADDMYIFRKKYSHLAENENHLQRSIWLIFFSEYLNDSYSFSSFHPSTLFLLKEMPVKLVNWLLYDFHMSFLSQRKSCMNLRVQWTKVYSLSHLSLVKFKQEYSIMLRNSQRRSVRPPAIAEQQNLWGKS